MIACIKSPTTNHITICAEGYDADTLLLAIKRGLSTMDTTPEFHEVMDYILKEIEQ